jgi:hypothetical protein
MSIFYFQRVFRYAFAGRPSFPKDIGEKANQNMRLNTFVLLMPYWANTKIALVYPESILRLRQLNVCFP